MNSGLKWISLKYVDTRFFTTDTFIYIIYVKKIRKKNTQWIYLKLFKLKNLYAIHILN